MSLQFRKISKPTAQRMIVYGPGGVGKTSLAAAAPGPVAFFDLERGLDPLHSSLPADLDVRCISGVDTFAQLLAALADPSWSEIKTIVIDSATAAERLAVEHTLGTVKHEKGHSVSSIEGYGFGKGYQHVYESWQGLLFALDRHLAAGRNIIFTAHDCVSNVPNPSGEDYIRWEPRLQSPTSGKASIRLAMKEWADHLLFIGYDVVVTSDGKASGFGSRTIYPNEMPTHMAKSRSLREKISFKEGSRDLWQLIFNPESKLTPKGKPATATPKAPPPTAKAAPAEKPATAPLVLKDVQDAFREFAKATKCSVADLKTKFFKPAFNVEESSKIPPEKFAECLDLIALAYVEKNMSTDSAESLKAAYAKLAGVKS